MASLSDSLQPLRLKTKRHCPYEQAFAEMKAFTDVRDSETLDEVWLVEHLPVFTQGQAGKAEHILQQTEIPIVQSDRGGQVTYHGPGQVVLYCLIDLKRKGLNVRQCVSAIEQVVINTLSILGIASSLKDGAPGVYVDGAKIASLGLRVRKGCTYHGLSLNVAMDLSPFNAINPCGYEGMAMTQVSDLLAEKVSNEALLSQVEVLLLEQFCQHFDYQISQ